MRSFNLCMCRRYVRKELTEKELEYLFTLYLLRGEEELISVSAIAQQMGVTAPTTVAILRKLASRGYVNYVTRRGVSLTRKGAAFVKHLLHRHLVLETYLVKCLGVAPREACEWVKRFDLYVPDELVNKLCEMLGRPTHCPCGVPIPHPEVELREEEPT